MQIIFHKCKRCCACVCFDFSILISCFLARFVIYMITSSTNRGIALSPIKGNHQHSRDCIFGRFSGRGRFRFKTQIELSYMTMLHDNLTAILQSLRTRPRHPYELWTSFNATTPGHNPEIDRRKNADPIRFVDALL